MCGITGLISRSGGVDHRPLDAMCDALRHRGPDDRGDWWSPDGRVGLAHRRLSIIDLSPGGHQPMLRGEVAIAFNGEIYNFLDLRRELEAMGHRFSSSSDTEVMLAAYQEWGTSFVARLQGMFAFALYDATKEELFVARDRAGEKPLFYSKTPDGFVFASELKALFGAGLLQRSMDPDALDEYLAYGYVSGDRCLVSGVRKLPPASLLRYQLRSGDVTISSYWTVPEDQSSPGASIEELSEELESLLLRSVQRQMISDVPIGVLLSGGVDSSLITAMAARVAPAVKTFTITFPGHAVDEGPFARLVAGHFGTTHHELVAEPATVELLPLLARQFDEPIADSSMIPTYLVSRLVREHATVAIGGDGGDELFGGYPHYSLLMKEWRLQSRFPAAALRALSAAASFLPLGTRGRNHLIGLGGGVAGTIAHVNMYFDAATRRRLLKVRPRERAEVRRASLVRRDTTPLRAAMLADFETYLPNDILVKVDRASMLTSLEVRAPFLDPSVIEFAFSRVPDQHRATTGGRKLLLRALGARVLPRGLDLHRKQGFSIPLDQWFKGDFGVYMKGILEDADDVVLERPVIRELIRGQEAGRSNSNRLFLLTMFELWRREYGMSL